jgi:hypothetical protein
MKKQTFRSAWNALRPEVVLPEVFTDLYDQFGERRHGVASKPIMTPCADFTLPLSFKGPGYRPKGNDIAHLSLQ